MATLRVYDIDLLYGTPAARHVSAVLIGIQVGKRVQACRTVTPLICTLSVDRPYIRSGCATAQPCAAAARDSA
jgi:hypothetical protein